MSSSSDENLLFGILALQMDLLQREQLIAATGDWIKDKSRSLGDILVQQGALRESDRQLLAPLVARHLENHDGDAVRCLAAISSLGDAAAELQSLGDEEIEATLSVACSGAVQLESRARQIFFEAVETPPADLDDYLNSQCGDNAELREAVQRLLASHQALGSYQVSGGTVDRTFGGDSSPSSTPASWESAAGNRFRVLRPHAKGGLGEVSVAKDVELNRDVALKEIQARFADDEASRSRFVLEAEVTGGLEHPGIVPVYGLGRYDDGRPFYAMRFIKGDSLQEAAERMHQSAAVDYNSVEFRKLLGRFIDVCEAIEYAHSRGVLHRDLKPGNIMLGKYGETLVVDWGLAKLQWREDVDEVSGEQTLRPSGGGSGSAPTQMGSAIGTPAFMPPEQASGDLDELGPASDVYSLGATLYYVLTAQRPFTSRKLLDVLEAVKRGDFASPRTVKPTVPKPLDAICLKAMSLKLEDRYASPMQLADDVQRWLGDEPVSAYQEPLQTRALRWVRRHQTLAASFTALLFTGLVALGVSTILISNAQRETADALVKEQIARKDADVQRNIADQKRQEADAQREITENALRENRRISANLAFDRAEQLSDDGKPDIGLHWYIRALELSPEEDKDFHELILANWPSGKAKQPLCGSTFNYREAARRTVRNFRATAQCCTSPVQARALFDGMCEPKNPNSFCYPAPRERPRNSRRSRRFPASCLSPFPPTKTSARRELAKSSTSGTCKMVRSVSPFPSRARSHRSLTTPAARPWPPAASMASAFSSTLKQSNLSARR